MTCNRCGWDVVQVDYENRCEVCNRYHSTIDIVETIEIIDPEYARGERDFATKCLELLLQVDIDNPVAMDILTDVYYKMKDDAEKYDDKF